MTNNVSLVRNKYEQVVPLKTFEISMTEHQIRHLVDVLENFHKGMNNLEQMGFTLGGDRSVLQILRKQMSELGGVSQLLNEYKTMS